MSFMINFTLSIFRNLTLIALFIVNMQLAHADLSGGLEVDPLVTTIKVTEEGYVTGRIEDCAKLVAVECSMHRQIVENLVIKLNQEGTSCRLQSTGQVGGVDGHCTWLVTSENGNVTKKELKGYCDIDFYPSCYSRPSWF